VWQDHESGKAVTGQWVVGVETEKRPDWREGRIDALKRSCIYDEMGKRLNVKVHGRGPRGKGQSEEEKGQKGSSRRGGGG